MDRMAKCKVGRPPWAPSPAYLPPSFQLPPQIRWIPLSLPPSLPPSLGSQVRYCDILSLSFLLRFPPRFPFLSRTVGDGEWVCTSHVGSSDGRRSACRARGRRAGARAGGAAVIGEAADRGSSPSQRVFKSELSSPLLRSTCTSPRRKGVACRA